MNLLFIPVLLFAMVASVLSGDYWVYVRKTVSITDANDTEQISGRSVIGDIVEVICVCDGHIPTVTELEDYRVIKITGLTWEDSQVLREPEYEKYDVFKSSDVIKTYRKNKLPLADISGKEVYSIAEIESKIINKVVDSPVVLPSRK